MYTLTKAQMHTAIKGACVLASGGGGSYLVAQEIIDQGIPDGGSIDVVRCDEVDPDAWLAVSANMGSPDALFRTTNPHAAANAFHALHAQCRALGGIGGRFANFQRFSFVLPAQVGSINTAAPFAAAFQCQIPVIDGHGCGRSIPELQLTVLAGRYPLDAIAVASEAAPGQPCNSSILSVSDEIAGEAVVIGLVRTAPFGGIAGLAIYPMTGRQMGTTPVMGSIRRALDIGGIIESASGRRRAEEIVRYLNKAGVNCSIEFHGHVTHIEQRSGGVDIGRIILTGADHSAAQYVIYSENENVFAFRSDQATPRIVGPDSICYIPAHGDPVDNSDLNRLYQSDPHAHLEMFVLYIEADAKNRSAALKAAWAAVCQKLGFGGCNPRGTYGK